MPILDNMRMEIFKKVWAFLIDSFQTILLAASIFLVVYLFIFRPFQVSGLSMYPNFHDKEYILTSIISIKLAPLKRGDVIVFIAPDDPSKDYIKRIIGLPGDTIMLKNGNVYENGKLYNESSYLKPTVKTYGGAFLREGVTITVPQGNYFVMGDNRPESSDSREWGYVSFGAVIGKSFLVYWPANRMQFITNPFKN